MIVHHPLYENIRFAQRELPERPPFLLEVIDLACTCKLRYHVTGVSLTSAAKRLERMVERHLVQAERRGEPTLR